MTRSTILDDTGLPPEVCDIITDQLSGASGDFQLILKELGENGEGFAIRNEDLPLLKVAATFIASFLASSSVLGWAPAAIASLVVFLYDYRKKRIPLTAEQAAILREIKRHPHLTPREIAAGIQIKALDENRILNELKSLTEIRRQDGVKVELAASDALGRWRVVDV